MPGQHIKEAEVGMHILKAFRHITSVWRVQFYLDWWYHLERCNALTISHILVEALVEAIHAPYDSCLL